MQKKPSDTPIARKVWNRPRVLTAALRETASPFNSAVRADGVGPGVYYNPS